MTPGSNVLEFHKKKTNLADHHSLIFWYMADALNIHYYQQECEPVNPTDNFFEADIIVDTKLLSDNMKVLFGY
jgi:hypothetical protein